MTQKKSKLEVPIWNLKVNIQGRRKGMKETTEVTIAAEESVQVIPNIQNLIYVVRGKQVMLDTDLAILYQVKTKRLNEAVKRNLARFPENFRFQLNDAEVVNLRSQIATSSLEESNYGGRRYLPYVFTEQGIAMLSAVLRSDIAINVSIRIMETFVEMRKYMANASLLYEKMNSIEVRQIAFEGKTDGAKKGNSKPEG